LKAILRTCVAELLELCEIHSTHEKACSVNAELREKLIVEVEKCWKIAGAENYESGIQTFAKLLDFVRNTFEPMRTKEQFREFLDQLPEPSWLERQFIVGGLRYLPQVFRFGLKKLSQTAEETLPPLPRGRIGIDLQQRAAIIGFVGRQHTKGYTLEQAKKSAAKKCGVSEATVQRVWDDRGSNSEIDFRSVLKYLADGPGAE
jgi:hypothetical protein